MKKSLALLSILFVGTTGLQAHFVWLERTSVGVAAYFGEYAQNVREKAEGPLGKLAGTQAWQGGATARSLEMKGDRLEVVDTEGAGDVRLAGYYRSDKGTTWVRYGARWGTQETSAQLPFELVPVVSGAATFRVFFQGQPQPNTAVTLFTQEGWSRSLKADASGVVEVPTPWAGQYVLEAAHVEEVKGEIEGRAYTQVRHVTTLTFVQP